MSSLWLSQHDRVVSLRIPRSELERSGWRGTNRLCRVGGWREGREQGEKDSLKGARWNPRIPTEGPVWISHKIRYAGAWNHDNKGAPVRYTKLVKERERDRERDRKRKENMCYEEEREKERKKENRARRQKYRERKRKEVEALGFSFPVSSYPTIGLPHPVLRPSACRRCTTHSKYIWPRVPRIRRGTFRARFSKSPVIRMRLYIRVCVQGQVYMETKETKKEDTKM